MICTEHEILWGNFGVFVFPESRHDQTVRSYFLLHTVGISI